MRNMSKLVVPRVPSEETSDPQSDAGPRKSSSEFTKRVKLSKTVSNLVLRLSEPVLSSRYASNSDNELKVDTASSSRTSSFDRPQFGTYDDIQENSKESEDESFAKFGVPTTISSDTSDTDPSEDPLSVPICTVNHSEGKTVLDTIVQTDVYTLFNILFSNSTFTKKFQEKRETANVIMGDWVEDGNVTLRTNTYDARLPVKMGPKHCKVTEKQILLPISKPGFLYAIDMESNNSGVPHADSFYLTFHYCLSRVGPTECHILIIANLIYRKPPWAPIKSVIDKQTWGTIYSYHTELESRLKDEFSNKPQPDLRISVPDKNFTTTVRRRPLRKKRPAPSIPTNVASSASLPGSRSSSQHNFLKPTFATSFLEYETLLKILITFLGIALLAFNIFLFIKVQSLEREVDAQTFINILPKMELNLNSEQDIGLTVNQDKLLEPLKATVEKLRMIEKGMESLKSLVKS